MVPKSLFAFAQATSSFAEGFSRCSQTTYFGERMSSLVRKLREMLQALWALSPTLVGLACLTLDLAALLHLRMKNVRPTVQTMLEHRRGE